MEEWRLKNSYDHEISSHIPKELESIDKGREKVTIVCNTLQSVATYFLGEKMEKFFIV